MKKLFAILLAVSMVLSLAACGSVGQLINKDNTPAGTADQAENTNNATAGTTDQAENTLMSITVVVVHKDGTSKEFQYETDEPFVGKVLEDAGLISGNVGQYGLEILTVDGEKAVYAEDNAYWALYEGEEYALQGIDTTPVKDGGIYKLVYTGA